MISRARVFLLFWKNAKSFLQNSFAKGKKFKFCDGLSASCFSFLPLQKDIFMLRVTFKILKLKLCLFVNERFGGFQNNFKSFDLVNFCTT